MVATSGWKVSATDKLLIFDLSSQLKFLLLFSTLIYSVVKWDVSLFSKLLNYKWIQEVYKNAFDFCRIEPFEKSFHVHSLIW